ncbi:MAG: RNA polymerase sigma factor [Cyclobacteriaceae bacterium]|nr:RNA polymerase sigma factor [Cyclobacteriaceae bacterium]
MRKTDTYDLLMTADDKLLEACIKGDRKAIRSFYERYAPFLLAVCSRYTKSQPEAEDVLQEAFIKIFKNLPNFRKESRLEYWMKRITVNTALNQQRNKLYMFPMVDIDDVTIKTGDNYSLKDYHFDELLKMVQELPAGCQVIFNLYAIEGFNHREIAEMLGISEGTSKSQYARARALLMRKLDQENKINYGTL